MNLSQDRLLELLSYDPELGSFVWLVSMKGRRAGTPAKASRPDGYVRIRVDKKLYYAHRLAWLYMTGEWPKHEIDHINGDPGDNRWCNLREATSTQNHANSRCPDHNSSGYKGVTFDRIKGRWRAYITVDGRHIFLGFFDTAKSAHDAYFQAAQRYFGVFARSA